MAWCLIPKLADQFKKGLQDGEITPDKLNEMSTQERTAFLEKYVGKDNAPEVNRRFERSLLLKNQDAAILRWAKQTAGITDATRQRLIDSVEQRKQERFERVFNPTEEQAFLSSLAEQKIGTEITREEAKAVFDLSKNAETLREKYDPETGWTSNEARLQYGAARVAYDNYVGYLKNEYRGQKLGAMLKTQAQEIRQGIQDRPIYGTFQGIKRVIDGLANLSISTVATFDNSFIGRQGLKVLFTNPKVWFNGAKNSFLDIAKTFGGQETLDALQADVLSRENAMNGNYEKAKILDLREEQFPTSLPERIPYVGRAFTASEAAFKGSALRMRTDLFDLILDKAKDQGVDITSKYELESIGKIVNSLTAKGAFNNRGFESALKAVLWAPKMLKANLDVLTAHTGQDISRFAAKEAWQNLFKITATTALILAIAKAQDEDSVELDPRSADFGKIRLGSTRIDITGGMSSIIVLASRMISGQYKSTTSGELTEYGAGFGEQSRFDALIDFAVNKVTPPIRVAINLLKGETFDGKEPTLAGELYSAYTPIAIQNVMDYIENPNEERGIGVLADFVGLSSNTYATSNIKTGIIPEDTKIGNDDFIHTAWLYAQAVGTDPETAFNRIFTGQRIRRIDNGTIIVERMPVDESQDIKEERGGKNPEMKLDHTIPLQLGGSNSEDNLRLVTTSEWRSYTPVENQLGELLRDGIITKKEAQQYIVDFKEGRMTRDDIFSIK